MKKTIALALVACLLQWSVLPAASWAAEKAVLEGIEVAPDQVRLRLSDKVKFNSFVTAQPPRVVIELLGTEHSAALPKVQEGKGQALKRVRSGQYQPEPTLITRIVLDLEKMVTYNPVWAGKDLVISLASQAMQAGAESAKAADAPAAAPEPAAQAPEAAPKEAELPEKMETGPSEELRRIALAKDAAKAVPARAARPGAAHKAAAQELSDTYRKDIMGSLSEDPVTLDFDNTDVREILRLMAAKAGVNVVYGPDVSGSVTLHLQDVPFREAFTTILSMQGLVTNQVGDNVLRVMTPATLVKERAVAVNQTRVIRLKYSKAEEVRPAIDSVRAAEGRAGKLVTDTVTNSIIITDTLEGIASVERLLAQLDTRPSQVMIEAKLVEVKLNKDLHFGIQWDYFSTENGSAFGKEGRTNIGSGIGLPAAFTRPLDQNSLVHPGLVADQGPVGAGGRGTGVLLPASKVFGAFTLGRITNNYLLSATLTAAAGQGKVKVLSDPKVTTLNGKKASINITTQIPYVTSNVASTGVTTQQVSYITTGIQLDVTPTVNADGRVTIEVNPRVSQPSSTAAGSVSTGAPAVDNREAKTSVLVQDGETIVIGGLITDSVSNTVAKIPLLGDIPFLGWLFKKKSIDRTRVELLIFVTTRVVPA